MSKHEIKIDQIQMLPQIIKGLEDIRKSLCVYGGTTPCDCKLGVNLVRNPRTAKLALPTREVGCGCAELRFAIRYLESLGKLVESCS